jgi:hypothetical protein
MFGHFVYTIVSGKKVKYAGPVYTGNSKGSWHKTIVFI